METKRWWYAKTKPELFAYFEANPHGLAASDVAKRHEFFGLNKLPEAKRQSLFGLFLKQFQSPLIYLLLGSAGIVAAMGEYSDGGIIGLVLLINACIGAYQEGRAARTLASLQKLVTTQATVLREGAEVTVPDTDLVPGDIVIMREGEKVPADCRILTQASVRVNESSLTGESVSVEKHAEILSAENPLPLTEQLNMLFRGTLITSGNCTALVVATGSDTIIGSISGQVLHTEHEIPLQKNIRHLAHLLILIVLIISGVLLLIGLSKGMPLREIFGVVISLAVSVIPEGLPIAVTLILASGVRRMSKRNALVKKLQAIEALGHVDIIAVDKTGTITKNEMTVTEILTDGKRFTLTGQGYTELGGVFLKDTALDPKRDTALQTAALVFALCGNARITTHPETEEVAIAGDPTDAALVVAAQKLGVMRDELIAQYPLVEELPFDYTRKFHATVHRIGKNHFISAVGAVEAILPLCPNTQKRAILLQARAASKRGLRVLAFAYNPKAKSTSTSMPALQFGGLICMSDPILPEVADTVDRLRLAGIRTVMITGDNAVTAQAIAESAGIHTAQNTVLTSSQIANLSPEALRTQLKDASVFARVTPQDKLTLVESYGKAGNIIAMTGDGVNDAPALLGADIGMAMGRGGTEVAKEAADVVILDNDFRSIAAAVEEGRNIYLTIRKVLVYLFSTSLGELFTVSAALILGLPLPLVAVQIIWLNFVTDGFLTVALGLEPRTQEPLGHKRIRQPKYLLGLGSLSRVFVLGMVMAAATLWVFLDDTTTLVHRQTMALTTLAVIQWFNAWNARTEHSILISRPWRNPYLIAATILVAGLHVLAVYWQPLQSILKTTPLSTQDWLLVLLASSSIFVADELYKVGVRAVQAGRNHPLY